jgi:hypothetical protein
LWLRRKLSAISYSSGMESSRAAENLMDSNTNKTCWKPRAASQKKSKGQKAKVES